MLRALAFDFRHDPNTYEIQDEYMFGPAFLVCPVTTPMYYRANSSPISGVERTRAVYLPSGSDWYDFWTGKRYAGGQTIVAVAPLETMPLYVRAGSIVPMGPAIQFADEKPDAPMELWVYPGQDGQFSFYEDEGDNYNYEQGNFATIQILWNDDASELILENREGSYRGMETSRTFRVVIANEIAFDPLVEQAVDARTVLYEGRQIILDF
jgi:alpha-D-xyloside xylohydrolase